MATIRRSSILTRRPGSLGAALASAAVALAACGGGGEKATPGGGADTAAATPPAQTASAGSSGEQVYQRCVTCHQANGEGLAGVYPPLAGSEFANAQNPAVPIRIVLHGLQGPVTVKGTEYNSLMPPYGTGIEMSDQEVADVLTYVRSSWGNSAGPVTAQQVAAERAASAGHTGAMTAAELQTLMR
jgi:mono/diheme cytochrome c family protein